jgi:monoamine oxidase
MQCIVDELKRAIETNGVDWANRVKLGHTLQSVSTKGDKVTLEFANGAKEANFDHVILALPYWPLKCLSIRNEQLFTQETVADLGSVFGFPMTKCFVGVKKAWWKERGTDEEMTNRGALQFPTREVHYMTSKQCKKTGKIERDCLPEGAILAYADRPASAFWANYVTEPGTQVTPEYWNTGHHGPNTKNFRLVKKLVKLIQENAPKKLRFTEEDIIFYGIRAWNREPYGAANHSWRAGRKSWEVLARLGAFKINNMSEPNFHICGEAYSDYHGFIEGALRSAVYVLHHIDCRFMKFLSTDLGTVDKGYFKDLEGWVKRLADTRQELGT